MYKKTSLILAIGIVLSGCGELPISSDVPEQLETLRPQLTPGKTSRKEVRERLGQPFISSDRWPVEVYRVRTGADVSVWIGILPFWVDTEEVTIYAMVVYNKDNVVGAIDWDVYQHDPNDVLTDYSSNWKFRSATLHAQGFQFVSIKEGFDLVPQKKEFLLAPKSETQTYLNTSPSPGKCAIVYFFSKPYFPKKFYIDGKMVGKTPLMHVTGVTGYEKVFVKVLVDDGLHELMFKTNLRPHNFRRTIACESQKRFFVYPHLKMVKDEPGGLRFSPWKYEGEISATDLPQEGHDDWQRLLFYNGTWIGDD